MKSIAMIAAASAALMAVGHGRPLASYGDMVADAARREPDPEHPPLKLSVDPASPHFHPCARRVGVRFNGVERKGDVREYDVKENWIEVFKRDRRGRLIMNRSGHKETMFLHGTVDPFWRDLKQAAVPTVDVGPTEFDAERIRLAEERRAGRAQKLQNQFRT